MAAYAAKADIQNYLGITIATGLDAFVAELITASEDYVEKLCGGGVVSRRWFNDGNTDKTFQYDGRDTTRLKIDDLREVTSVAVLDGSGASVALVKDTDYYLYPLNARAVSGKEEPYTEIQLIQPETRIVAQNSRLIGAAPYIFDKSQKSITIVGKFGYSTTPPALVKMAVVRVVAQFIKDKIGDNSLRELTSESLGEYSGSFEKISNVADRLNLATLLAPYIRKDETPSMGVTLL